jgi:hypothetical protein
MHLYVRFYELNKENIQETLVNYRCQKTFQCWGRGSSKISRASQVVDFITFSQYFECFRTLASYKSRNARISKRNKTHKRNFSTKFIVKFCFLCALGAKKYDFEFGAIGKFFSNLAWYCTLPIYWLCCKSNQIYYF